MQRHKRLFGQKTNRYFNYKIGAYSARRSLFSVLVLPVFSLLVIGSVVGVGYAYFLQKNHTVLNVETQKPLQNEVPKLTQEQIDQKSLQPREDQQLTKFLQNKINKMPKDTEWSVSLRDLKSGRMANVNADEIVTSASLYKLFLLAPLEKRLSADSWQSRLSAMTIKDCVTLMIRVSDNDCARVIGSYANWKNADIYNQSLGFKATSLSNLNQQVTTSREVSDLMYRLQNSQILSDKARRIVFDALYEQKYRDGIAKGCGQDCLVASKHGDLDGYHHDAAIVTHGQAKYVLVIMTKGASWQQIADLTSLIDQEMIP